MVVAKKRKNEEDEDKEEVSLSCFVIWLKKWSMASIKISYYLVASTNYRIGPNNYYAAVCMLLWFFAKKKIKRRKRKE